MNKFEEGLKLLERGQVELNSFRKGYGQMALEGLVSKGYARIKNDKVRLTAAGARAAQDVK